MYTCMYSEKSYSVNCTSKAWNTWNEICCKWFDWNSVMCGQVTEKAYEIHTEIDHILYRR